MYHGGDRRIAQPAPISLGDNRGRRMLIRQTLKHEALSEELRELNVYTGFSPFQPEGEITAKINIPAAQIEKAEFLSASDAYNAVQNDVLPAFDPSRRIVNPLFVDPSFYNN